MTYIGFPILSLIYLTVFLINYFSKKRIDLFENKIISALMIINGIGLILELGCYVVLAFLHIQTTPVGMFILKTYIYYMYIFDWVLTGYIYLLTHKKYGSPDCDKKSIFRNCMLASSPIALLGFFATYFKPLFWYDNFPKIYTYGFTTDFLIYVTLVIAPFWMLRCFSTLMRKEKQNTTRINMILLGIILVGLAGAAMQYVDRSILIITSAHTLMLILIYFTIENPDLRMLEEIMSSKRLNEQANEEKSNMILQITDKVRNPITEISNISGYLLTKNKDSEVEAGLKDIKKISDNAYDYINNALDISGADSSLLQETKYDYNLNTLLNELVLQNKDKISSEVEFRTNFAKTLPTKLNGDGVKLKQIITTVLLNSIKHTTKGFIEFNVDQVTKYDVCRLLISIEDTGAGISQSKINELLDVKEDLTEEEASKLNELDLNLNIVNKLLRLIGGTINITSEEGKGTKIDIVLDQKISNNQDKEVEKLYEYGNYEFNKKKVVLISEDEAYIREFKRNAIGLNINLECLNSAKECLDKIRNKEDIEVIFTEEDLSKINANDLLIKLKNEDNFNNKIVLISNCEVADQIKEYLDKGFYKVLKKNAPKKEVVDTINKLIDM